MNEKAMIHKSRSQTVCFKIRFVYSIPQPARKLNVYLILDNRLLPETDDGSFLVNPVPLPLNPVDEIAFEHLFQSCCISSPSIRIFQINCFFLHHNLQSKHLLFFHNCLLLSQIKYHTLFRFPKSKPFIQRPSHIRCI